MKKIITAADIRAARNAGQKSLAVPEGALVTPQAVDDARDYGIALVRGAAGGTSASPGVSASPAAPPFALNPSHIPPSHMPPIQGPLGQTPPVYTPPAHTLPMGIAPDRSFAPARINSLSAPAPSAPAGNTLEVEVRRQVMARLGARADAARVDEAVRAVLGGAQPQALGAAGQPFAAGPAPAFGNAPQPLGNAPAQQAGGVVHVRKSALPKTVPGASTAFNGVEMVETVIPAGVSSPGSGYLMFESASFSWTFSHAEILVILEGELSLSCEGLAIVAAPGDIVHLPAGSSATLSATGKVCCVCGSWPAA